MPHLSVCLPVTHEKEDIQGRKASGKEALFRRKPMRNLRGQTDTAVKYRWTRQLVIWETYGP